MSKTFLEQHRVVFRFVLTTDGNGNTETHYFTTHGFSTNPGDIPASTYIPELVSDPGDFMEELYVGNRLIGASGATYGTIVLENKDGALDSFARIAGGGTVTAWWGKDGQVFPDEYFQLYQTKCLAPVGDFDVVKIEVQSRMVDLDQPIVTASFTELGDTDISTVANRKQQLVFGKPGLIPLITIDHTKQVYFIQANASDITINNGSYEFGKIFENGVPIDLDSNLYPFAQWVFTNTPDEATYKLYSGYEGFSINHLIFFADQGRANDFTKGPYYARLGGVPVGELRFGPIGLLQNLSSELPREWRFTDLCNRARMSDVYPGNLGTVAGQTMNFSAGNRLIDGDQTYLQTMNDRCQALLGCFGFNRLNQLYCFVLKDPEDGDDSSQYTFTKDNATDFSMEPIDGLRGPVWMVNVKAGRAHPCPVNEAASAEMRDILTREGHYVNFTGTASKVKRKNPDAVVVDLTIDGHDFPSVSDQVEFVNAFGRLFGTRRDFVGLKALEFGTSLLSLSPGTKVTVQRDRYGYDSGVLFRVLRKKVNLKEMSVSFLLWGNNSGYQAWTHGGGGFPDGAGDPGGSWGAEVPPDVPTPEDLVSKLGDFTIEAYIGRALRLQIDWPLEDFTMEAEGTATPGVSLLGPVVYQAENISPGGVATGDPVTARASFMARLSGVTVEDFEGFAEFDQLPFTSGSTLNGTTCTYSTTIGSDTIAVTAGSGRFNTTSGGANYNGNVIVSHDYPYGFSFSTPIAAFGMYFTDLGDFENGKLKVRVYVTGGGTVEYTVNHSEATSSGGLMFWGIVNDTNTYDAVELFRDSEEYDDAFAFDDFVFCTPAYLA